MNLGAHSAHNTAAQPGLPDVVNKNTGHPITSEFQISNKKCPVVYLKFKRNWVSYILSDNPVLNKPLKTPGLKITSIHGCPRAQSQPYGSASSRRGLGGPGRGGRPLSHVISRAPAGWPRVFSPSMRK